MVRGVLISAIIAIILGFILFLFFSLGNDPSKLPTELEGKPLPAFTGYKLNRNDAVAEILSNDDIEGPALLNVWATWCENCKAEHAMLKSLGEQGIRIYGINYKDDSQLAYRWLQDLGDPYLFSIKDSSGKLGIELGVYGAPETFFLDKNKNVIHRHVGEVTAYNWENELKHYYYRSFDQATPQEQTTQPIQSNQGGGE